MRLIHDLDLKCLTLPSNVYSIMCILINWLSWWWFLLSPDLQRIPPRRRSCEISHSRVNSGQPFSLTLIKHLTALSTVTAIEAASRWRKILYVFSPLPNVSPLLQLHHLTTISRISRVCGDPTVLCRNSSKSNETASSSSCAQISNLCCGLPTKPTTHSRVTSSPSVTAPKLCIRILISKHDENLLQSLYVCIRASMHMRSHVGPRLTHINKSQEAQSPSYPGRVQGPFVPFVHILYGLGVVPHVHQCAANHFDL